MTPVARSKALVTQVNSIRTNTPDVRSGQNMFQENIQYQFSPYHISYPYHLEIYFDNFLKQAKATRERPSHPQRPTKEQLPSDSNHIIHAVVLVFECNDIFSSPHIRPGPCTESAESPRTLV